jgi:CheY-like chemotaxis protein
MAAGAKTAMVVEDEMLFRLEVADLLAEEGYSVIEVASAEQALARLTDAVSLVVTDVHMPGGMDGLSLARAIARDRPDVALVIVSARVKLTSADLPHGAEFVGRPFLESRIRVAVRRVAVRHG